MYPVLPVAWLCKGWLMGQKHKDHLRKGAQSHSRPLPTQGHLGRKGELLSYTGWRPPQIWQRHHSLVALLCPLIRRPGSPTPRAFLELLLPTRAGRWVSGGVDPGVCIPMHSAHLVGASSAHSPISEDKSRRLCARPPRPRPQAPHLAAATDPGPDHMGTQATGSSVP